MNIDFSSEKPIYIQIAEGIEDAILSGAFEDESQVPSITEFSVNYKINPATALKGITLLVDDALLYKKRGLGMFVSTGAKEKVMAKRKNQFYDNYVYEMLAEANRLQLTKEDIISMIERGYRNE